MSDSDHWTYTDYVFFLEISAGIRVETAIVRRALLSLPLKCLRFFWPELEISFDRLDRLGARIRDRLDQIQQVEGPALPGGETHAAKAVRKGGRADWIPGPTGDGDGDLRAILEAGSRKLAEESGLPYKTAEDVLLAVRDEWRKQCGTKGLDPSESLTGDSPAVLDGPDNRTPEQRAVAIETAREKERAESPDGMTRSERAMSESEPDRKRTRKIKKGKVKP